MLTQLFPHIAILIKRQPIISWPHIHRDTSIAIYYLNYESAKLINKITMFEHLHDILYNCEAKGIFTMQVLISNPQNVICSWEIAITGR